MQINPLAITKGVVSFVVASGTSKIIGSIVRNNVSPEKVSETVAIYSATVVLGAMAADATKKYTDKTIDEIAQFYNENVKPKLQK